MTNQEVIQALKNALVFDAFVKQANQPFVDDDNSSTVNNIDNCSMLLAVATGKVIDYRQIYEIMNEV